MGLFNNFPWTNLHELNLQWIVQTLKKCYSPDNPPEAMVISVNGESGEVILYKNAVIRFPDVQDTQWNLWRNTDGVSTGIQFEKGQPAKRIDGQNRIVIYDANNPPPYPVVSVNGETGEIELYTEAYVEFPDITGNNWGIQRTLNTGEANETQVGIMFDDTGKAKIIKDEDSNDLYSENNPPPYPVMTVDGNTGNVQTWAYNNTPNLNLPIASNSNDWSITRNTNSGELSIQLAYNTIDQKTEAYVIFDDGTNPPVPVKLLTLNDIPSSAGVVSFNGLTGALTITGSELHVNNTSSNTIANVIDKIQQDLINLCIPVIGDSATQAITAKDYVVIVNSTIPNITDGIYQVLNDIAVNAQIVETDLQSIGTIGIINALQESKLDKTDVINNLTTATRGKALDASQGKVLKDLLTTANIDTIERIARDGLTTGATGNIATPYPNSGTDFIVGACTLNGNYIVLPFVASASNGWYLKVVDSGTMQPVANVQVDLRYVHIKLLTSQNIYPYPI